MFIFRKHLTRTFLLLLLCVVFPVTVLGQEAELDGEEDSSPDIEASQPAGPESGDDDDNDVDVAESEPDGGEDEDTPFALPQMPDFRQAAEPEPEAAPDPIEPEAPPQRAEAAGSGEDQDAAETASIVFPPRSAPLSERVEALSASLDYIEDKVQSTMVYGGSSPVSFSGEARIKVQYHNLGFDAPGYMQADRSYLQSGWEGNENLFRLGMVARAGRNLTLWSKIGLQHTMMGNHYYEPVFGDDDFMPGYTPYQYRHDKAHNSITIHEDLCAGIAVRTLPASFWVKLGNTLWTEASPLTVWKSQPRTFAWEYLPFEVEQPIARYYEYNIAKGIKDGRAAWNKKPFNGINVESINLPANLYANFVYGTFERYDNFEREYIDFAGDLGYADGALGPFPFKGHGVGDSYRHAVHGRLAMNKLRLFGGASDMTLGFNYIGIDYNDDVLRAAKKDAGGADPPTSRSDNVYLLLREFRGIDSVFVKEPKTLSLDIRGPINEKFAIHTDVAVNWIDTVWFVDTLRSRAPATRVTNPDFYSERRVANSDIVPAVYTKLSYTGVLPTDLDIAYIAPGFYSPFSFATPMDAFYAFGSNMVGAGKFIARGEGSPYTQNMAGANLTLNLPEKWIGYGHARLKYGQHFNITEDGRDLLFFPYRLNGSDMFSFFHSSFNRWGNSIIDNSVKAGQQFYKARLGDESFVHMASYNTNINAPPVAAAGSGGLRSDYLSMFEGFVPYNNAKEAFLNFSARRAANAYGGPTSPNHPNNNRNLSSITHHALYANPIDTVRDGDGNITKINFADSTQTSWVPTSRKSTFNLELDAAFDIGKHVGYKKDLFVGGYAGVSGVTRGFTPLAFDAGDENDDMLLWSFYLRLEPAIALHKNFYLLGLFGFENWRSEKSWMVVRRQTVDGRTYTTGVRSAPPLGHPWNTIDPVNDVTEDNFVRVPIDFQDVAFGVGFDWDMLERVGLHARMKYISHADKGLNAAYDRWESEGRGKGQDGADLFTPTAQDRNDWGTWVFSLELKTWF